jgi:hypothetical protein
MVQQPTGCGHEHIHATSENLVLAAVTDAAMDQSHTQRGEAGELAQRRLHLPGQFPGGFEDQRPWTVGTIAQLLKDG